MRRCVAILAIAAALAVPGGVQAQTPPLAGMSRLAKSPPGETGERPWGEPVQGHAGPVLYDIQTREDPAIDAIVAAIADDNLGWLRAALDRAELYRSYIMGLIERYGLPADLINLPLIESEYRPWVVSRSGAAGMWQFMPNSVDSFDIRIDDMVDERRDFWKSSDAALRKLRDNHRHFGDWLLALAAYNCGVGRLDRIIAQTGIHDFWLLREGDHLPPETARFVPKFLGTTRVANYPGRHGVDPDWDTAFLWDRIPVDRPVNIELLAAVTGASLPLLERANAELHYPVTPEGNTGYALKVPRHLRERVVRALADPEIALMKYHVHTIRTGDTLYGLGRTFGVSADLIQRHNVAANAGSLRIGSKLFIPLLGDPRPDELLAAELLAAEPPRTPLALTQSHTVAPGDTLWALSRRYGVSVEDLASGNGLEVGAILRPGALLKVPDMSIMALDE